MSDSVVYTPVFLEENQQRAIWEAYRGAKIKQDEWNNRQPAGPYLTLGKSYLVFRRTKCASYSFVEVMDDFGKFTVLPACHFKSLEEQT